MRGRITAARPDARGDTNREGVSEIELTTTAAPSHHQSTVNPPNEVEFARTTTPLRAGQCEGSLNV